MSENTKIEWCDHTMNPWTGCTKISPLGCAGCYAEAWSKRAGAKVGKWGPGAPRVRTTPVNWKLPIKWNANAKAFQAQHGRRQRVFCASLADVFDNEVDPQWRLDLFSLIMATPNLDWLLLTKRVGNVQNMVGEMLDLAEANDVVPELIRWLSLWIQGEAPANVWLGATVVNQEEADRDIPKLIATPARVRFLSMEPLLGPVTLYNCLLRPDYREHFGPKPAVDWVIAGGESGPGARPSHPDWYRSLRDQCAAASVPFLFKQWGEWLPISQQEEEFTNRLYKSNRIAALHEDQSNLDDCYGRRCTVASTVIHEDGTTHGITEPMAFLQGTGAMTTFKVGKKAASRLLDGIEHNGFPI